MTKSKAKSEIIEPEYTGRTKHNRDKWGESPDPTPVHIPGECTRPPSLREDMRRFIREEISKAAVTQESESFEESDDFEEVDGEADIITQYTVYDLAPEPEQPADDLNGDTPDQPAAPAAEAEGETDDGSDRTVHPGTTDGT